MDIRKIRMQHKLYCFALLCCSEIMSEIMLLTIVFPSFIFLLFFLFIANKLLIIIDCSNFNAFILFYRSKALTEKILYQNLLKSSILNIPFEIKKSFELLITN